MANRLTQFKLEIPTMTNNQGQVVEVPGMRPIKVLQSTLPRPRVIYNNGNNLVLKLDDAIFNTGVNNEVGVIMKRLTPILTPHNTTTELIEQISRHNRQIGRELKYLRRLNHQHLIKMHYCYPHEDTRDDFRALYVYMPWYGAALDKVMNQLGLEHVPFITYQLLNAVAFLHSANILHRDIKVENILCNEACVIKLIDYGLSRVDDGVDQTQYVVTRYYRAPELLLYRPYTKSVDMWAIGCVVAELLTRQKLFLTNAVGEGEHIRQLRKIVELAGDDATRAWMLNEYPVLTENGGVVAQSIFVGERIMVPDGMSATDYIHRVTTGVQMNRSKRTNWHTYRMKYF